MPRPTIFSLLSEKIHFGVLSLPFFQQFFAEARSIAFFYKKNSQDLAGYYIDVFRLTTHENIESMKGIF